jgi:hypothetical protein
MGFANDLDRRARRSNDAEPNRKQCTPPENLTVGYEYPEDRKHAVSCGGFLEEQLCISARRSLAS